MDAQVQTILHDPQYAAQIIARYRHNPQWQEAIRLAIQQQAETDNDAASLLIVQGILGDGKGLHPSPLEEILHRDILLAGRCLTGLTSLHESLRNRVLLPLLDLATGQTPYPLRTLAHNQIEHWGRCATLLPDIVSYFDRLLETLPPIPSLEWLGSITDALTLFAPYDARLTPHIITLISHPDSSIQQLGVAVIVESGIKTDLLLYSLRSLLTTPDETIHWNVLDALTGLGVQELFVAEGWVKYLTHPDGWVRGDALRKLVQLGVKEQPVVEAIILMLTDEGADIQDEVVRALTEIGITAPYVEEALIKLLNAKDMEARFNVVRTINILGFNSVNVALALYPLLQAEYEGVSSNAAWGVSNAIRIQGISSIDAHEWRKQLLEMVNTGNTHAWEPLFEIVQALEAQGIRE